MKQTNADIAEKNYDRFFGAYQNLLVSENYVVRRQSLKLLGELLLDRHNFNTMTRYIANPDNLKLMMNMLRERSRNIQFEAFHVFKVCMHWLDHILQLSTCRFLSPIQTSRVRLLTFCFEIARSSSIFSPAFIQIEQRYEVWCMLTIEIIQS